MSRLLIVSFKLVIFGNLIVRVKNKLCLGLKSNS